MRLNQMRYKIFIALAILASLVVGFLLGHYSAPRMSQSRYDFARDVHASYDVRIYIEALNLIHAQQQSDAISFLDSCLDHALIFPIGNYVTNRSNTNPEILGALKAARDYRKKYPCHARPDRRFSEESGLSLIP